MKKLILIAVITLGALVSFGPVAQAAEKSEDGKGKNQRGNRPDRLETMKKDLALTDAQVEKLKPIMEEDGKKMREIMQDTSMTQEQRRAKITAMREASQAKVKAILTKEQFEKYEKMAQERRQRQKK